MSRRHCSRSAPWRSDPPSSRRRAHEPALRGRAATEAAVDARKSSSGRRLRVAQASAARGRVFPATQRCTPRPTGQDVRHPGARVRPRSRSRATAAPVTVSSAWRRLFTWNRSTVPSASIDVWLGVSTPTSRWPVISPARSGASVLRSRRGVKPGAIGARWSLRPLRVARRTEQIACGYPHPNGCSIRCSTKFDDGLANVDAGPRPRGRAGPEFHRRGGRRRPAPRQATTSSSPARWRCDARRPSTPTSRCSALRRSRGLLAEFCMR